MDPQLFRIPQVQGMFGIDKRGDSPRLLRLGDYMQGERGLAGGLWAEDLDHPPSGKAAHSQREVQPQRSG